MMSQQPRAHYEWLQAARGIAALAVVLTHAALMHERNFGAPFVGHLFSAGNVGVDFFFVLSGFIIYFVHQKDIATPRQVLSYAEKRFTRVYPMFWLITLPLVPAFFIGVGGQKAFDGDWWYVVNSLLLLPQDDLPILSVAWTLTHEVYFYLLFAFVIVFPRVISYALIAVIAGLSVWKLIMDYGQPWGGSKYFTGASFLDQSLLLSFATSRHTLQFFAGCFIAHLCMQKPQGVSLLTLVGAYVIFFLPFLSAVVGSGPFYEVLTDRSLRTIYYTLASGLVVYCSIQIQVARRQTSPPDALNRLGDSSYSLYLIHYPIILAFFVIFVRFFDGASVQMAHLFTTISIALAVLGGWIAYFSFERPMLKWSRRLFSRFSVLKTEARTSGEV